MNNLFKNHQRRSHLFKGWAITIFWLLVGCSTSTTLPKTHFAKPSDSPQPETPANPDDTVEDTVSDNGNTPLDPRTESCKGTLVVPAAANPFHAKGKEGDAIFYEVMKDGVVESKTYDNYSLTKPVLVDNQACLQEGKYLLFLSVSTASNTSTSAPSGWSSDGNFVPGYERHYLGATNGISDIIAPLTALVGVFIDDAPAGATVPPTLSFASEAERNFLEFEPQLNQVFFIGNGLNEEGTKQKFKVPKGATKFFLGTMDTYEWNNNSGEHKVDIQEF